MVRRGLGDTFGVVCYHVDGNGKHGETERWSSPQAPQIHSQCVAQLLPTPHAIRHVYCPPPVSPSPSPVSTSTHCPEHLISASGGARPRSHHGEKRGMGGSARNTLRCLPGSVSGGSGRLQGRRRSRSPRVGMGTASATQRATYAFVAFCARLLKPADGLVKRTALRRFAAGALTCVSRPRAWME